MIAVTDEREAAAYDADLFAALWRPVVAAASVVFVRESAAADESALREALDGFLSVAKIAGRRKMTEVMDHLIATLCAFATPPHLTVEITETLAVRKSPCRILYLDHHMPWV